MNKGQPQNDDFYDFDDLRIQKIAVSTSVVDNKKDYNSSLLGDKANMRYSASVIATTQPRKKKPVV